MKKILKKIFQKLYKNEKGFGLIETIVALAIIGTSLIVLTQMSLSLIKEARKNEIQSVAVESAVEAEEFLRDPMTMKDYKNQIPLSPNKNNFKFYNNSLVIQNDVLDENCSIGSVYFVSSLGNEGYIICRQVTLWKLDNTSNQFNYEIKVVFKSVNGKFLNEKISGTAVFTAN